MMRLYNGTGTSLLQFAGRFIIGAPQWSTWPHRAADSNPDNDRHAR